MCQMCEIRDYKLFPAARETSRFIADLRIISEQCVCKWSTAPLRSLVTDTICWDKLNFLNIIEFFDYRYKKYTLRK